MSWNEVICALVNDVRPKEIGSKIERDWLRLRLRPFIRQINSAAASLRCIWFGESQPSTDMGMLLLRYRYRFI